MKTRRRWDRAAGAVLAITGVFLLVFTVVGLAPAVSDLGSTQGHLADEAVLNLAIFGPMLAVVVLSTLGCAWLLWRGWRGARALALVWIEGAGLFAAQDLAGGGDTWLSRVIAMVGRQGCDAFGLDRVGDRDVPAGELELIVDEA
jgi:hypothetical protein